MQTERKFDLLYDPLYKTSDSREAEILEHETYAEKKQQKLPSYKNMFSALPDRYPSFSLRSQSLEAARPDFGNQRPPSRMSSASPTRSAKTIKLRRTPTSPQKPTSPSLRRSALAQTPKKVLQENRVLKGSEELYPMALDHAKLKGVFEKALPPITDSGSLALRKQLLEAWECAEWESREAQIRALQEAQLKEFEDGIRAQHAQADGSLSERLSARWATKSGEVAAAVAKAEHQATKRAQQLIQLRQKDEYKLAGIKSGGMDDIMSAVGRGMMKVRKDTETQADLDTLPKEAGIGSGTVYPEIPAHRFNSLAANEQLLRPPSRKELAYAGHLDRVHQTILAKKGHRAGAEDISSKLAKATLVNSTRADILVVDASPEPVLAEEPEEAFETAVQLAIAAEPASQLAVIDATAQPDTQAKETGAEPAAVELEVDADDADPQTTDSVIDQSSRGAYKLEGESANDVALEPAAQESLTDSLWAVADEVAVMTEQLLDEAIQGGNAMDTDTPHNDELALDASVAATIDGLVSTTEGTDITADEGSALRNEGDVTGKHHASTMQAAIDVDWADDSALADTEEMLASKAVTGSLRGAEEGIINVANTLPIEGYGSIAEEQHALADSILSGGDSILNRASAVAVAGADSDPALLNEELDGPSPVSGDTLTLDRFISSRYVPRASTEALYSTSHLISLDAGLSLTSPYTGDYDADSAQDSPVGNLDSMLTEDDSAPTQPADDAYPEGSPAPGVSAPLQLQGDPQGACKEEEESPVQAEGPHDDEAWSIGHPEGAPHEEGALEVKAGPSVLSPGSAEHTAVVSAEQDDDLEVSPVIPSLAYGAQMLAEMPEELELASKDAALRMHEEQETLPGAPAADDIESFILEEADSAEPKVSISLQARQEWVVGAELTLQDSEESPGAQSTGSVEAATAEPNDEIAAELRDPPEEVHARGHSDKLIGESMA